MALMGEIDNQLQCMKRLRWGRELICFFLSQNSPANHRAGEILRSRSIIICFRRLAHAQDFFHPYNPLRKRIFDKSALVHGAIKREWRWWHKNRSWLETRMVTFEGCIACETLSAGPFTYCSLVSAWTQYPFAVCLERLTGPYNFAKKTPSFCGTLQIQILVQACECRTAHILSLGAGLEQSVSVRCFSRVKLRFLHTLRFGAKPIDPFFAGEFIQMLALRDSVWSKCEKAWQRIMSLWVTSHFQWGEKMSTTIFVTRKMTIALNTFFLFVFCPDQTTE